MATKAGSMMTTATAPATAPWADSTTASSRRAQRATAAVKCRWRSRRLPSVSGQIVGAKVA